MFSDMNGNELRTGDIVKSTSFVGKPLTGIISNDKHLGWIIMSIDYPGGLDSLAEFHNRIRLHKRGNKVYE